MSIPLLGILIHFTIIDFYRFMQIGNHTRFLQPSTGILGKAMTIQYNRGLRDRYQFMTRPCPQRRGLFLNK